VAEARGTTSSGIRSRRAKRASWSGAGTPVFPCLEHRFGQFLDEQRHPVSAHCDRVDDLQRHWPLAAEPGDDRLDARGGFNLNKVTCGHAVNAGCLSGRLVSRIRDRAFVNAQGQRQGRTLHPDAPARVGLCPAVPQLGQPRLRHYKHERPHASLARQSRLAPGSRLNNLLGNHISIDLDDASGWLSQVSSITTALSRRAARPSAYSRRGTGPTPPPPRSLRPLQWPLAADGGVAATTIFAEILVTTAGRPGLASTNLAV
jgi:hypothetical protein